MLKHRRANNAKIVIIPIIMYLTLIAFIKVLLVV